MLKIHTYTTLEEILPVLQRPATEQDEQWKTVSEIVADIRIHKDAALEKYSRQFDNLSLQNILSTKEEWQSVSISEDLKQAIEQAYNNIYTFHAAQKEQVLNVETSPGVLCYRKALPIQRVGLYIPGGTAPLFSTLLMLAIPAAIAGCKEIVLCTPPDRNGNIHPAICYTAMRCGIEKIYKIGGAQAIAAMTFGTETIPQVYKIFGPGNSYVTLAKQLVQQYGTAIDMPAGPSELAILADASANPAYLAADLLSQAEHGTDSQVVLVSDKEQILKETNTQLAIQLARLPRKSIAEKALQHSAAVCVPGLTEGMEILHAYAPEHLILACENASAWAEKVQQAGSVFIGHYACESLGDYASGTNHTLPTAGFAKAYSGVSLSSFCTYITFQQVSKEGLQCIGPAVITMAEAEGLQAHAEAVKIRL